MLDMVAATSEGAGRCCDSLIPTTDEGECYGY